MAETKKFLDLAGLKIYDGKIKAYISEQIGGAGKLTYKVVSALPTENIDIYTIYLVPNTKTTGQNVYTEYMYINSKWEVIGTTETNFDNYYTKAEIDATVSALKGGASDTKDSESIKGAKLYADDLVANKNVAAEGETGTDALVSASAADNKVTVASTQKLKDAVTRAEGAVLSVAKATGTENFVALTVNDGDNATISINDAALKTELDKIEGDENTAGSFKKHVKDTIDALAGDVTSDDDTYVTVEVKTSKGEVSDVIVSQTVQAVASASASAKGLAEAKDVKDYVDGAVAGKNVSAEGDDYVTASAANNKVTVAASESTKASLALADSAVQTIETGVNNGTIKVDGTEVAVKGLASAAFVTVDSLNATAQGYANDVLGATTDTKDNVTVYGARKYAEDLVSPLNPVAGIDEADINALFTTTA